MSPRSAAALLAAALFVAPAAAADTPAVTAQVQPVGKILDDLKAIVRAVGGDDAVKQFDDGLKKGLGEKGFAGLDLLRQPVGFGYVTDPVEESFFALALPVTDKADFLGLLDRLKIDAEEDDDHKGVYDLSPREGDDPKIPIRLRFHNGYAFVGFNGTAADLDPKTLPAPADLLDPKETAVAAERVSVRRLPAGLKKQAEDQLQALVKKADGLGLPPAAQTAVEDLAKMAKRVGGQVLTDGDAATYRLRWDPRTLDAAYELGLTARPGTPLAAAVAARTPTTNRFAGLLTPDAAAGFTFQMPLFAPEVGNGLATGIDLAQQAGALADVPPQAKDLVAELVKGLTRTVKAGELDTAGALAGPDKDGLFTATFGVSYDDTADLDKLLRKMHADAPEEVRNMIKLDAAKAGGVAIHKVPVGLFLPADAKKLFGGNASLALALAPKGVYLAFGPGAVDALKAAVVLKPAGAKALDVVVNPKRLHAAVAAGNEQSGRAFAEMVGTEDKAASWVYATIEGGDELRLRLGFNLAVAKLGQQTAGGFAVPPGE